MTYGVAPITLSATGGGSGNPVSFSLVSGPGTLSGANNSTLTISGAGTVVVAANQAGSANFRTGDAGDAKRFTVNPASLVVTANSTAMPFGGTIPTLAYAITGFVNGDPSAVIIGRGVAGDDGDGKFSGGRLSDHVRDRKLDGG